jgi:hypothetical protein
MYQKNNKKTKLNSETINMTYVQDFIDTVYIVYYTEVTL